jgi:hypothetical protein
MTGQKVPARISWLTGLPQLGGLWIRLERGLRVFLARKNGRGLSMKFIWSTMIEASNFRGLYAHIGGGIYVCIRKIWNHVWAMKGDEM